MTQSTLYETLQVAAARRPDHPAIVMSGRDVSYAELLTQTDQIAASLVAIGVEPGDRLALMMSNGPEFVASFVAISSIGAAMVALNRQLSRREITEILAEDRAGPAVRGVSGRTAGVLGQTRSSRCIGSDCRCIGSDPQFANFLLNMGCVPDFVEQAEIPFRDGRFVGVDDAFPAARIDAVHQCIFVRDQEAFAVLTKVRVHITEFDV